MKNINWKRVAWVVGTGMALSIPFLVAYQTFLFGSGATHGLSKSVFAGFASVWILGLTIWQLLAGYQLRTIRERQNWLIDAVNSNIERLNIHALASMPENKNGEDIKRAENPSRWPWGNHHTQYLGHLEAAARKWWTLYDPSDPTTAPTNEIVADWLQSDRNLSRERARAIASMLRPDGLPTGPRK